jgi:perosamine synthetase
MIPHSRPTLGREEKKACEEVLDSLQIAQGERVRAFEQLFCDLLQRRYAVAVSSGTSALTLSLLALGISKGDEVICPSFTCVALLHAIHSVGAEPALVDIDPEDFNISVSHLKKRIRKKTKAVIVPHAFGRASRMNEILELGIRVVEDGTQALGARVGEKKVGSFGEVSLFSFYATKMITTGEGGIVLTDSSRVAKNLLDLRDYDKKERYQFRTNSKMTDLEAAMGIEQVSKLPLFIKRRREIASRFQEVLQGLEAALPSEDVDRDHVYYRYVVRVPKNSQSWLEALHARGIDAKRPIFKPLHRYLGFPDSLFPATDRAMKEACSLPIYPSLSSEELGQICQTLQGQGNPAQKKRMPALVH